MTGDENDLIEPDRPIPLPWQEENKRLKARVEELEAENAALRQGIHPPTRPMPGGFSMENFMNGCPPEDIAALCDAMDLEPLDPS